MKASILLLVLGVQLDLLRSNNPGAPPGAVEASGEWNHEGRDYWPRQFAACNGKRQSPIDIRNQDVKQETFVKDLDFNSIYKAAWEGKIRNTGHSLQFDPTVKPTGQNTATTPRIKDGALDSNEYDFLQAHFHWGSHSEQGSEHTIDGVEYPLELHLVHTKKSLYSASNNAYYAACEHNGEYCGLSVVGILFHVGSEDNAAFAPFVDAANTIAAKTNQIETEAAATITKSINFWDIIKQTDIDVNGPAYYYYKGSLTTPGCNEVVNWIVLENSVSISESQLASFRKLKYVDGAPMVDNYRHPQPVNNRVVKRVLRQIKEAAPT